MRQLVRVCSVSEIILKYLHSQSDYCFISFPLFCCQIRAPNFLLGTAVSRITDISQVLCWLELWMDLDPANQMYLWEIWRDAKVMLSPLPPFGQVSVSHFLATVEDCDPDGFPVAIGTSALVPTPLPPRHPVLKGCLWPSNWFPKP